MTSKKKVQSVSIIKPESEETFTTDDLHCCAALICAGHKLIRLDGKKLPHNDVFVLRRDDDIESDARAFWLNTLIVPARSYSDEIEALMSMAYGF